MSAVYDNLLRLSPAFSFGALLGLIHFMGLLATVSRLPECKHPYFFLILSFVIRMAVVMGGLYWIGMNHWERLLAALAGLILARIVLIRFSGRPENQTNAPYESGDH
jgi:F1F0 ATPase subunit 2